MKFSLPKLSPTVNLEIHLEALFWPLAVVIPMSIFFMLVNTNWMLLAGVVLVILLLLLLFLYPDKGLLALIVARPAVDILGTHVIQLDRFSINIASWLSIMAIVWSVWFLVTRGIKVWTKSLFWPMAVFMALAGTGLMYTMDSWETVSELLRLSGFFLLYFVALEIITTQKRWMQLTIALGASLLFPAILGWWQFFTHTGLSFSDATNRVYGSFGHPNVFAFYLVLLIGFFLTALLHQKPSQRSSVSVFFLLVLSILLLLTGTRGAWIGLALTLLILGIVRYRLALLYSLFGIVFLLATAPISNSLTTKYLNIDLMRAPIVHGMVERLTNRNSWDWRTEVWKDMSRKFWQQPVRGYGLGTFPILRQQQVFDFFQGIGAHNDYLRLMIEMGLAGLAAYLVLLVAIGRCLIQWYRRWRQPARLYLLGMIGFTCALVFMSFLDNLLQATAVMWVFWIMLAAVHNLPQIMRADRSDALYAHPPD